MNGGVSETALSLGYQVCFVEILYQVASRVHSTVSFRRSAFDP